MTVKELIKKLQELPEDLEVVYEDYEYGYVEPDPSIKKAPYNLRQMEGRINKDDYYVSL